MKKISLRATAVAVAALAAGQAWATNGMLMEGYGPIALSMGGASQAYDNGTAGMMNNPATLQLGDDGTRADIALGILGPKVNATWGSYSADSTGTSYVMPAVGWVKKDGQFSYGVGVFAQGGMGTEYGNITFLSNPSGMVTRSELGVGRLIFPVSYRPSENITVGASLDYSWAGMDMAMSGMWDSMSPFLTGGTLAAGLGGAMSSANWAGVKFTNSNSFTGAAKGAGWTGKVGMTFQANPNLKIGVSHQLATNLSNLKTTGNSATFESDVLSGMGGNLVGDVEIKNFQMPSSTSIGLAFNANPKWLLVADVKQIDWAKTMKSLDMTFTGGNIGMSGTVDMSIPANWKNQTVISVGSSYSVNEQATLRFGYSHATDALPHANILPIFPATVRTHYTAGVGYQFTKKLSMDVAVSHAPTERVVNADSIAIKHSQTNYQLMLSYRY